ncbi:MAG: VWA domain-containing protein [Planctomycetota bacterium]
MSEWELRDPWFLLAAFAAPLVYFLAARMPSSIIYSDLKVVDLAPRTLRARLAKLPAVLLSLATVVLAVALAGPRTGDATTRTQQEGIAIVTVVDHSGSMRALDFGKDHTLDRLQAVKGVLKEFVLGGETGGGRPNDLIGLVAFATYADGLCPLTLDHRNLVAILDDLEVVEIQEESLTAIGEGLALAVERLRKHSTPSKVVILLTDGVNNAGEIDPLQAAELAAANKIKVYCIGAGTNGVVPFPAEDRFGRKRLVRQRVEIDEKTLQEIARKTGGRYFHATNAEGLSKVYKEIDRLERTEVTEIRYLQYSERYLPFVVVAMSLLAFAAIASGTFLRRLP